jgi:hypothetical protein
MRTIDEPARSIAVRHHIKPPARVGELETKDATRHRIKWYARLAIFREQGVARLEGILP